MTILNRSPIVVSLALSFCCVVTVAQQTESPERLLQRAIATLDSAETERGADLLRTLLASVPSREAIAVRADAHMFLGAASMALGQQDSAIVQFREVVTLNPFYRPDPERFNPDLTDLFHSLRVATTVVRLRAPADTTLAPMRDRYVVSVGVGKPGDVIVRLRSVAGRTGALLATLALDSIATVEVPLLAADGTAIEAGGYELEAVVTTSDGRDTDILSMNVERMAVDTTPHEPPIPETDFRPEERRGSPRLVDLGRGLAFGLAATAAPTLLGNRDLRDAAVPPKAIALGAVIALADIVASRPMRPIPDNIDFNARLRAEWEATNLGIAADNDRIRREARLRIRTGGER
jgi:hypothetical protein